MRSLRFQRKEKELEPNLTDERLLATAETGTERRDYFLIIQSARLGRIHVPMTGTGLNRIVRNLLTSKKKLNDEILAGSCQKTRVFETLVEIE